MQVSLSLGLARTVKDLSLKKKKLIKYRVYKHDLLRFFDQGGTCVRACRGRSERRERDRRKDHGGVNVII